MRCLSLNSNTDLLSKAKKKMDVICNGVMKSNHPKEIKTAMLKKIGKSLENSSKQEFFGICSLFSQLLTVSALKEFARILNPIRVN